MSGDDRIVVGMDDLFQQRGVFDKLREMGIEDGDTVRIFNFEFDFYG